ncbi:TIGR03915 family putative DNA repair protein [Leeuwenhoekiella sp. A2]|uniref:TIGR03915 family putative DNA repair protein n=1 Tax=Leeuwenhoekiella sp. A2 TaxID=3141460 RepID=UPI003A80A117
MQHQLAYDGSFDGFLTAVFTVYEEKLSPVSITSYEKFQEGLFEEKLIIYTDEAKANRVWKRLKTFHNFSTQVYWSFLSETDGNELVLLKAIEYVLATGNAGDYGHEMILQTAQLTKMVGREKHRMEAFVRFKLTSDQIYFAQIEPDFDVLPLISSHFKNRYADQKWIIYDLKRSYGLYYDLKGVEMIKIEFSDNQSENAIFAQEEAIFDILWRDYFKSTTISSRINMKLHIRHIPKRYWKYLNEKSPR